ncbi:uncharacterized protein LOC110983558 isoform X2 [Acanthaster planci]|uniref:Uncharacterized protein LOC110983558 isoform X2 n=1 Tax=Acanthaster planci TaxID=133434 RepID=A0A8B7YZ02_ACAPL|nr:uncharacterized protein LOC110983558 isoform X2 [Acanthaster planci]
MPTTGAKSQKTGYHLSPNEEAALIKREKERRRKLRIQQVREQERNFASKVRSNVNKKKDEELKNLALHMKKDWEEEKKEKTDALQKIVERSLDSIGDGHRAASNQPPLAEIRAAQALKDQHSAIQRYNTALKRQQVEEEQQYLKENAHIIARKSALQAEKIRAAKMASLPPPVKDPLEDLDDVGKENKIVIVTSGFSTSHYHLKGEYVEKAEPEEQEDARLAAQEEERRAKEDKVETEREEKERQEKACLRHQHARKQELLHQDYNKLMEELGHMEQADRRRRQTIVANIPHQVFQPPHKRLEDKQEEQQKLEQAFEDMYMANTDYTGDLILALEPKPQRDTDLDVTVDSVSDDVGISLQPVPILPADRDDGGKRLPQGLDEESEEEAEKTIAEEKPKQPRAPLKKLMDRIKSQREELKKKVVLEVPSPERHPREELETPSSSRDLSTEDAFSPSPEAAQEESESDRGTLDTLESGTLSEDTNKLEEKRTLLHPLEEAAKIRSVTKVPEVELQKKAQEDIIAKEDEQRLRLAEKQLQEHMDHRDHLQMLQDNLLQRQRMLQQHIGEQERLHREQLQLQQEQFGKQQPGLWNDELQPQLNEPLENQHPQSHNVHAIQRLIRQLQISDQQRQLQRAQQLQVTQQQQQTQDNGQQQHDLTQYQDLPNNLLRQPNLMSKESSRQKQHLQQQQVEVNTADFQLPRQRISQLMERERSTQDLTVKPAVELMDPTTFPKSVSGLEQKRDFQARQIPVTVEQGHGEEWLRQHLQDTVKTAVSSQLTADQAGRKLPSRDTLQEAQLQLEQRRERLMQLYPELQLPPYEPYIKNKPTPDSTEPMTDMVTDTPMYQGAQIVRDAGLGKDIEHSDAVQVAPSVVPISAAESFVRQQGASQMTGVSTTCDVSAAGVSVTGVSSVSKPEAGLSSGADSASAPQLDVLKQTAHSTASGLPLNEMERKLEQHRQQLLKTWQQLQQQQQQQQQRILDKQKILVQRIGQQRQEQLSRQQGQGTVSEGIPQNVIISPPGTQVMMTSQPILHDVMSQIPPGIPRALSSTIRTSHPVPPDVVFLQCGTQDVIASEPPEVTTVHPDAQPKVATRELGVPHIKGVGSPEFSQQVGQTLSKTKESSDGPSPSRAVYKLPSMTLGKTSYHFDPTLDVAGKSVERELPSFHELSLESSAHLTENSDHQPFEVTENQDVPAHGQSGMGIAQHMQQDWGSIFVSGSDPNKQVERNQSALPSQRLAKHTRPPPSQWRLPQMTMEAGPHELSTILEGESPEGKHLSRGHQELNPLASTPHKTSPFLLETSQQGTQASSSPFYLGEHASVKSDPSGKASQVATPVGQVSGINCSKTLTIAEITQTPNVDSHSQGQVDTSRPTFVPSFAMDVGRGVLSYPSSNVMTEGPVATVSASAASSIPVASSHTTPIPIPNPANIHIASPVTDTEEVTTQPDSTISMLSEHTLVNSLQLSDESVEQFLALSASESSTSDSASSTSARYQVQMLGSDKRSTKSPVIKNFVMDIPSRSSWKSSFEPSIPPFSQSGAAATEVTLPSLPTAPRQSIHSEDYNLGPVSPQSTWTDTDTQSGSYLAGGAPFFPMFRGSDIPKDGMSMFSDVSLSHYNTSLESGPTILPISTVDPGQLNRRASPSGESEQWFMPQQKLDNSELHQPDRGSTVKHSRERVETGKETLESETDVSVDTPPSDDESSKLSYAGALVEEPHDPSGAMVDDTLQEAMRNIAVSESETSKETGIIEDPDLTLISLNSTLTSFGPPDDSNDSIKQRQWVSEELGSDSLVSFLHHEEEMKLESPARSGLDQSKAVGTSSLMAEDQVDLTGASSEDRSISLQEAFMRHKQSFIRSTQSRQLEVKVHAESHQATAFSQTLDNWKRSRGGKIHRPSNTRTSKSPSKGPAVRGKRSGTGPTRHGQVSMREIEQTKDRSKITRTVTSSDRKAAERDMYLRNIRLYNQLEEVQKWKLTQQRKRDYAANRQRRKEFGQKLQARFKLTKQTGKSPSLRDAGTNGSEN